MQKIGRNDPCPCGSGKKYKHCCALTNATTSPSPVSAGVSETLGQAREFMQSGRFIEAELMYSRVAQSDPQHPEALNMAGLAALSANNHVRAAFWLEKAIRAPLANFSTWFNLGIAQYHLGKFSDAIASYRKALQSKPDKTALPMIWYNLGLAQHDAKLSSEALTSLRKSLALFPKRAETQKAIGDVHFDLGELDQALDAFGKALELDPSLIPAHNEIANVLKAQGKLGEAIEAFRKLLDIDPAIHPTYCNLFFSMALDDGQTPEDFQREKHRYQETFEKPVLGKRRSHPNSRDPQPALRIGYVSPDFRRHAVANFIEPILANADREHFQTFCYYNRTDSDAVTARLQGYATHWRPCHQYSDEQLAEIVRMDGIDILVDLAGHTADNRLLTFALKPAPLQITYLGYPGSSWLDAMDYRITDNKSDPPGSEVFYAEKLLHMPDSLFCYSPQDDMPEVSPSPCQHNGHITFGSFASFSKIDEQSLELWAELMLAVPQARLLMLTVPVGTAQTRLRERFAARGVAPERLTLHGKLPRHDYLAMMREADIALDPVMVNSPTTMCETLWMGLPTISQFSSRCASRAGLSILSAARLEHLAVPDAAAYIAAARTLAENPAGLTAERQTLRQRLLASPLMDGKRFTSHLEAVYREIWQDWCKRPEAVA